MQLSGDLSPGTHLSAGNKKKLESFHHSAILRILNIKWHQVRNEKIRHNQNRKFRPQKNSSLCGKVIRSKDDTLPKGFLGAWMHCPRKTGCPQLSCNNNFAEAISVRAPNQTIKNQVPLFKEWCP
jgi:hypothetical protein